jgi:hypothetical protein
MPDFSDEQSPLVVYNVPGVATAQLCDARRVHDAAGIHLRMDAGKPPSVTSGEHPHRYSRVGGADWRRRDRLLRVPDWLIRLKQNSFRGIIGVSMARLSLHMVRQ